jgi:hypothetical protein
MDRANNNAMTNRPETIKFRVVVHAGAMETAIKRLNLNGLSGSARSLCTLQCALAGVGSLFTVIYVTDISTWRSCQHKLRNNAFLNLVVQNLRFLHALPVWLFSGPKPCFTRSPIVFQNVTNVRRDNLNVLFWGR